MKSYPVMLDINDKQAVVVGGGRIAYRKVIGLLQAGAKITIISPEITKGIEELMISHQIIWHKKVFERTDLDFAFIVIAATDSEQVNKHVALSVAAHQLINVVDHQVLSTFHVPAKLTRGDLTISVATDGASPTLAKVIRDELAEVYDESYEKYLEFLSQARLKINHTDLSSEIKIDLLKTITDEVYRKSTYIQQAFLEMIEDEAGDFDEIWKVGRYADRK